MVFEPSNPASVIEDLPEQLRPFAQQIGESKLPHVDVTAVVGHTKPWESKLRGVPYYPKDRPWPTDVDGKALVMLLQINFEEMPSFEGYPSEGILQIYISADYVPEKQMWGMRNDNVHESERDRLTDQSWFRVVYFSEISRDMTALVSEAPQVDFDDDYGFPATDEARLTFVSASSYVSPSDYRFRRFFGQDGDQFFYDADSDVRNALEHYERLLGGRYFARIGGYSRVEQEDPRLHFPDEDWLVLFSLDSESNSEYAVSWGGGGVGNFYIRRDDLARRDFRRVMYYWDFG